MSGFLARLWKLLSLPKDLQLRIMRVMQDQFLVGVTGVIFNDRGEVLLFKHTYRQSDWGLPGGYLKAKEHPQEGLEREIHEESGLTVSIDKRYKIRTDRETARLDIVYIGTFVSGNFLPSPEVSDAKFFTFNDLPLVRKKDLLLLDKIMSSRNSHT
jgi:ADP-ribose pyrophosphatase YjhB (NUDIX family)